MRLTLHGGFGEKGRTCVGVEAAGYRLLLDAGVKTSARGSADYFPLITPAELRAVDAILVSHGHEDHVGALGWCLEHGFGGRIFMTAETRRETDESLAGYATPSQRERARDANVEALPVGANAWQLGPLRIATGRSGHIAGGVWCVISDGTSRFGYCGDVVPASPVFAMDPLPPCDVAALDASYADDDVPASARAAQIATWIAGHPGGCVLATPLYGRSAELLAIVPGPIALAPGMRAALRAQLSGTRWLVPEVAKLLAARLAQAADWPEDAPLPQAALLCHDGMGMAGPAQSILASARLQRHPTLFTGHLPTASPGERMVADGLATWIRLPTHPTLSENLAIARGSAAAMLLGHSCDSGSLARLARHLPALRSDVATGARIDLANGSRIDA
jgi:glyoxylase-like metal-dependent hydrolase (beta-lactamase superfamily II)